LVTIPERRLRDLEASVVQAHAQAERALEAAARANDKATVLEALIEGLRELLDGRIAAAIATETERTEPLTAGFESYRRRVLASEGRRA
jgi:hypothetical protein